MTKSMAKYLFVLILKLRNLTHLKKLYSVDSDSINSVYRMAFKHCKSEVYIQMDFPPQSEGKIS